MKRISFFIVVCLVFLIGCVGPNTFIFRDKPYLVSPARRLAENYLDGQKQGESRREASERYGPGAIEFYGLKEYRYEYAGFCLGFPMLRYRIQATNQMGGVIWENYDISFSYDEKRAGSEYEGLKIVNVSEALFD